ncbi:MAG TPA: hypothetical protein VGO23_19510 [Pseudonocardia sp.]|jgi:hypothetical protein|nr:hypothetical protein [Pseudonocardia sp.]
MSEPTSTPPTPEEPTASAVPVPTPVPVPIEDAPLPAGPAPDYDEHGTPSLDYVRDKIEGRHATALGWQELTGDTEAARTADEKFEEREQKGKDKLAEIRKSLGL